MFLPAPFINNIITIQNVVIDNKNRLVAVRGGTNLFLSVRFMTSCYGMGRAVMSSSDLGISMLCYFTITFLPLMMFKPFFGALSLRPLRS